jgi:SH3-like domain-containing protein
MKNNKKYYSIFIIIFFISLFFNFNAVADDKINFLSLKNNVVNLRQGPSFEYPIKLTYEKKYLPVVILDKSGSWRNIKDFENNSGWIHISQLSSKKSAINIKNHSIIYKNPTIYSEPLVKLELGRLVLIKKCRTNWCKISTGGYKGWIFKDYLWGKV